MCGIIGAFNKKERGPVNQSVIDIYEDQHARGKEGFGVIGIDGNMKPTVMRATEPVKFMFDLHAKEFNMILAHHRMPTSTPNKLQQTHPIFVSNKNLPSDFLVVHNGVISNSIKMQEEHEKLGFVYTTLFAKSETWDTWNDSESLAIEVALFITKLTTMIKAEGSAAFIALELDKTTGKLTNVHFGRNDSNPLKMAATRGKIILSSEGPGENIKPGVLYSFDPKGNFKLKSRAITFHKEPKAPYVPYNHPTSKALTTTKPNAFIQGPKGENWKWDEGTETYMPALTAEQPVSGFKPRELDEFDADPAEVYAEFMEEVELELNTFFAELSDPAACEFADPVPYLQAIKSILDNAKSASIKAYDEQIREAYATEPALPIDG